MSDEGTFSRERFRYTEEAMVLARKQFIHNFCGQQDTDAAPDSGPERPRLLC